MVQNMGDRTISYIPLGGDVLDKYGINNGVIVGKSGFITGAPTLTGGAFNFDGSTYIQLDNVSSFNFEKNQQWSIGFWFKDNGSAGVSQAYISNTITSTVGKGLHLMRYFDNKFYMSLTGDLLDSVVGGANNFIQAVSTATVNTNTWQWVVCTYNGINGTGMVIYLNGANNTASTSGGATVFGTSVTTRPLFIGARGDGGTKATNVAIGDVFVCNYVLTAAQITSMYNSNTNVPISTSFNATNPTLNPPVFGVLLNGDFKDTFGSLPVTYGVNQPCIDAKAQNTFYPSLDRLGGLAWNPNNGGRLIVNDTAVLKPSTLSISIWWKTPTQLNINKFYGFCNKSTSEHIGWKLGYDNRIGSVPSIWWEIGDNSGSFFNVFAPVNFSTNEWHHIVGVFDPTATFTQKVYVDGLLSKNYAGAASIFHDTNAMEIGEWANFSFNGNDGLLSNIFIFNYALTSDQVNVLYKGYLSPSPKKQNSFSSQGFSNGGFTVYQDSFTGVSFD